MSLLPVNLLKLFEESRSGVYFLTTNNNKSCQIFIEDGVPKAVNMGRLKGADALKELENVGIKEASFKNNLILPYSDAEKIQANEPALAFLGYPDLLLEKTIKTEKLKPEEPAINSENKEVQKKVRMYRGQIIE